MILALPIPFSKLIFGSASSLPSAVFPLLWGEEIATALAPDLKILASLFFATSLCAFTNELAGDVQVIDGDTIKIAGLTYRINGIDAPEAGQSCATQGGAWNCGKEPWPWVTRNGPKHLTFSVMWYVCVKL